MGINQIPIVDQYADINRRLSEIQRQSRQRSFRMPQGISIISSRSIPPLDAAGGEMFFVMRGDSLVLSGFSGTLNSTRGHAFILYLRQFFPSLKFSDTQIYLGKDETAWLAGEIGLSV
jgi:hypothetical protein